MAEILITDLNGNYAGTDGDDVFLLDDTLGYNYFAGSIDGLGGTDRIRLLSSAVGGSASLHLNGTISGIEEIELASVAGQDFWVSLPTDFPADGLTLIGGAGRDGVNFSSTALSVLMPDVTLVNWTNSGPILDQDYLFIESYPGGATVSAREGLATLQVLASPPFAPPSALIGSSGRDVLIVVVGGATATAGADDDYIEIGAFPAVLDISGGSWDGGTGTDTLIVLGDVRLNSSSLTGMEAIWFLPIIATPGPVENLPPTPGEASTEDDSIAQSSAAMEWPSSLTIDTPTLGTRPAYELQGTGTLNVNVVGGTFKGDLISFADGADVAVNIYGGDDATFILGTGRADALYGNGGADILRGADGNDVLFGGDGNDQVQGGAGDDLLYGGLGNDTLLGGAGNDTLSYADLAAGVDPLAGVKVDLRIAGGGQVTGLGGFDTLGGLENIVGTLFNDSLKGNAQGNVLTGLDGNDALYGNDGGDTLLGGAGDDLIEGGNGDDAVTGDAGNDTLSGGNGNDVIDGADGNDTMYGDAGNDSLIGGDGNDRLDGGFGRDSMAGGAGDDVYTVDNSFDVVTEALDGGRDLVVTNNMNVTLSDNVENLLILGTAGKVGTGNGLANKLTGGDGSDTLYGMDGADLLIGGAGDDNLFGGAGADKFQYLSLTDAAPSDHIRDFSSAEGDIIDLGVLDGKASVNGNNRFDWIGTAAFGQHEGELRYALIGTSALVQGDVNGDGKADFSIVLDNIVSLSAGDFIL